MEQPVWNPKTNSFWISVPQINGKDPGGIAEISIYGTVKQVIDFGGIGFSLTACGPTGLGVSDGGLLMVGCGAAGSQTVVVDSATGKLVTTLSRISSSDELYYDSRTAAFYVTGVDTVNGRAFDVFSDTSFALLQSVALAVGTLNAHSISVDPGNGDVYVPLPGGAANTLCPNGCVAVFGVPEPGTAPLFALGLIGVFGLVLRRKLGSA